MVSTLAIGRKVWGFKPCPGDGFLLFSTPSLPVFMIYFLLLSTCIISYFFFIFPLIFYWLLSLMFIDHQVVILVLWVNNSKLVGRYKRCRRTWCHDLDLKTVSVCCSETLVYNQTTTWRNISEGHRPHIAVKRQINTSINTSFTNASLQLFTPNLPCNPLFWSPLTSGRCKEPIDPLQISSTAQPVAAAAN
jgi:hypothetical protein